MTPKFHTMNDSAVEMISVAKNLLCQRQRAKTTTNQFFTCKKCNKDKIQ
jgi:hypothetical protein